MARLFVNSFSINSTTSAIDGITYSGSPTIDTTIYHGIAGSDNHSLKIASLVSGTAKYGLAVPGLDSAGPMYLGFMFYAVAWPSAANLISYTLDLATTGYVGLKIDNNGLLSLFRQTTQVGSSYQLELNRWYHLCYLIDKTPADGSEVLRGYVNGVEFAGASNLTLELDGITYFTMGGNLLAEAQTTGEWYFDDFAANDTTTSVNNGVLTEEYIASLYVNASGDNNAWARGGADSGANWSQVEENPPNEDTDYVSSNTLDQTDDFNLDSPTFADASQINCLQLVIRKRGVGASLNASAVSRIKAAASGTVTEGSAFTDANATYDTIVAMISTTKPGGSNPWSKKDLENTQIGYRLSATSTNALRITHTRLDVAFTPPRATKTINIRPRAFAPGLAR